MKKLIILFLLLAPSLHAQFVPFGAWKSGAAIGADTAYTNIDSLKALFVGTDIADSLGKSDGDTTYIWPNRAKWLSPYAIGDAYQLTDTKKPTYDADSAGLAFDGVDDFLFATASTLLQPTTIIAVCRWPNSKVNFNEFIYDGSTARNTIFHQHTSNEDGVRMFAGSSVNVWGVGTVSPDSLYIFTSLYSGANSYTRKNGTTRVGNVGTQGLDGLNIAIDNMQSTTGAAKIVLRELIVYHKELTALELSNIEKHLATKYGITLP